MPRSTLRARERIIQVFTKYPVRVRLDQFWSPSLSAQLDTPAPMTRRELREMEKKNSRFSPRSPKAMATNAVAPEPAVAEFRIEEPTTRGITVLSDAVAPMPISTGPIPAIARRPRGAERKALGKKQHTKIVALSGVTSVSVAGAALAAVLVSGFGSEQATASASASPEADDAVSVAKKIAPVSVSNTADLEEGAKANGPDEKAGSEESENFAGGKPDKKPKSEAASRDITRTALPGCDGERPAGEASNGELPEEWLCEIGVEDHKLRADAALAFAQMNAAYKKDTGESLAVTDSYRDMAGQVSVAARKPGFAARPGTSEHGWGIALDMAGGTASASGQQYEWLKANAKEYGWENPDWAARNNYEPWHWEYFKGRD